jgi:hypothetical protein
MWWIGLIAGIGLVLLGARMRWQVEKATEGKGPGFMWPDLLFLAGISAAGHIIHHELQDDAGLGWVAAGLLGLAMASAGLLMRPVGQGIAWSWGDGPVKNSTRTGKALFLLGGIYLLGGVVGILNSIRFG